MFVDVGELLGVVDERGVGELEEEVVVADARPFLGTVREMSRHCRWTPRRDDEECGAAWPAAGVAASWPWNGFVTTHTDPSSSWGVDDDIAFCRWCGVRASRTAPK